jgi:UDP-glucose 4-epimerase
MMSTAPSMNGARVLVTGGAGFVGSTIVDQVLAAGARDVIVLDDLTRGRADHLDHALDRGAVCLTSGDIADRDLVSHLMEGVDVAFHQAALRITQCAQEPRRAVEVLVDGTFNVVEAAAQARVGRLVMASSASVYGEADQIPTAEHHHPYADRTLYGAAKLFGEGLLRAAHDMWGLEGVALRYFNVYGPRMDVHGVYTEVLVRWMERLAAGQPPLILGDGTQTLDLVHVSDVARANLAAATAPWSVVSQRPAYNVASGVSTRLVDVASLLAEVMEVDVAAVHGPERAVNGVRRRQADTTAARLDLGFEAEVPLRDGLIDLVSWWRSQTRHGVGVAT